jgi:hypothetical protein
MMGATARGSCNVVPPRRRGLRCGRDKVRPPTPRRADRAGAVPSGHRGRSLAGLEPAARQEPRRRPAEQRGRTGEPNPHGAAGCARGWKHEGLLQSAGKLSSACWSSSAPLRATRDRAWARYGGKLRELGPARCYLGNKGGRISLGRGLAWRGGHGAEKPSKCAVLGPPPPARLAPRQTANRARGFLVAGDPWCVA